MITDIAQNQLHFTSRNSVIRLADDIARRVNVEYPCLSSTKFEGMNNSAKSVDAITNLFVKIINMRNRVNATNKEQLGGLLNSWKNYSDIVKETKLGNCNEAAVFSEVAARVNGIRNCFVAELKSNSNNRYKSLDHAVLYVDGKKPYIIDAWLGFADYVPQAIKRFKNEYRTFLNFSKGKDNSIVFDLFGKRHVLSKEENSKLKELFPNLIIKKDPK